MPRRFKEARVMNNLKAVEAAEKLGVATPTLSAWESEKKSPPLDAIIAMAKLYSVSVDYLIGNDIHPIVNTLSPIPKNSIVLHHSRPVWVESRGWALVNSIEGTIILWNGHKESYLDSKLFLNAPSYVDVLLPNSEPLLKHELDNFDAVWVEPISPDTELREELRGWYSIKDRFAENEFGYKFYKDLYNSKWIAFKSNK